MKGNSVRGWTAFFGVLVVLSMTLGLVGCGGAPTGPAQTPETIVQTVVVAGTPQIVEVTPVKQLHIALVMQAVGIPFFASLQRGAEQAGKDFGVNVQVVGPPLHDADTQIAMFDALANAGVDGLIVGAPVPVWDETINAAIGKGIPVLTTNSDAVNSKRIAGWEQDFETTGHEIAKALVAKMGTKGVVGIGWCVSGAVPLVRRLDGFKAEMAQYPDIKLIGPVDMGDDQTKATEGWTTLISAHPEMTGTFGLCATDPQGAGTASKELGRKTLINVGYDLQPQTLELIKEGWVYMALGQAPYLQGYLPVMALVRYLKDGQALPKGLVPMPEEQVTSANVDEYIPRESDVTAEQAWYAKWLKANYPKDYPG